MRRKELAVATERVTPKILLGPIQLSAVEREHHTVNQLPPAPWCELCVMGGGKMTHISVVTCARRENSSL